MGGRELKLTWTMVVVYSVLSGLACAATFGIALLIFDHYFPGNDFMALMAGLNGVFLAALLFGAAFVMVFYFLGIQVHLRNIGKL